MRHTIARTLLGASLATRLVCLERVALRVLPRIDESPFGSSIARSGHTLARLAHEGRLREGSNEAFLSKPIEVARLLERLDFEAAIVTAALLSEIDDDWATPDLIARVTTPEVTELVRGCAELSLDECGCSLERALCTVGADWRVGTIAVAVRWYEMKSSHRLSHQRRENLVRETMRVHAPIAHLIGFWHARNEMLDACVRHLDARAFQRIRHHLLLNSPRYAASIAAGGVGLHEIVERECGERPCVAIVSWRVKAIHSVYFKMCQCAFSSVSDVLDLCAMRVVVEGNEEDCYTLLTRVHARWTSWCIKDYIRFPKTNGYRSLHTVVRIGEANVEIQIRTAAMHDDAENGASAHWRYKAPGLGSLSEEVAATVDALALDRRRKRTTQRIQETSAHSFAACWHPYIGKSADARQRGGIVAR